MIPLSLRLRGFWALGTEVQGFGLLIFDSSEFRAFGGFWALGIEVQGFGLLIFDSSEFRA